jgi:REP element-mobilizing transposase RayT
MARLFRNKYRSDTLRLQKWNYGWNGIYFVTIPLHNRRKQSFGEIINGKMHLSEIGEIAFKYWAEIPNHFPDTRIDEFIIMPDHIHGIIIIDREYGLADKLESVDSLHATNQRGTLPDNKMSKISPKPGSLSTIIRSYKSAVTRSARKIDSDFKWQQRFYENIVGDKTALNNIRNYIINNPKKWDEKK